MAGDSVGTANQILTAAAGHRLPVRDELRAGMAVFGLGEMFVAVRVSHSGGLAGAAGEREGGYAEARGASPSPFDRMDARF